MKKASTWAGVLGGLIVIITGVKVVSGVTNPTNLPIVNIANVVTGIAWIAFGVFLFAQFLKSRQKEDNNVVADAQEVNELNDTESLNRRRNWILGIFIIIEALGSVDGWVVNNYSVGLTLINFAVVFDICANILFLYIVYELLRNKKKMLSVLLYTAILYGVVWIGIEYFRHYWASLVAVVFLHYTLS